MWVKGSAYIALVTRLAELEATLAAQEEMVERLNSSLTKAYAAWDAERKRSDNAVDRLLNSKGLPAVTPPDKVTLEELSSMFEETPESVEAIHKAIEEHGIEEVLFSEGN